MALSRAEIPDQILTATAAGTIVAQRAVVGTIYAATQSGAGVNIIGIAATSANTGDLFPLNQSGVFLAEAGAAVTAGAHLEVDSLGRFIPLAAGKAVGVAYSAATAAGQLMQVQVISQ
jgi:predicted RecA/RadA family phage recombinase